MPYVEVLLSLDHLALLVQASKGKLRSIYVSQEQRQIAKTLGRSPAPRSLGQGRSQAMQNRCHPVEPINDCFDRYYG